MRLDRTDGVLLDMDGTLLDTETIYHASTMATMQMLGYADAGDICHAMIGVPGVQCEAMLVERYGTSFPVSDFTEAFSLHSGKLLAEGIPLKPGAGELLDALTAAQCPRAIVTSSGRRTAERHLSLAGIRSHFDVIVSNDDVRRGKPAPDLYLLAAERLGLDPERCLAIEDSNPGVTAAHAAGVPAIMVPDILAPKAEVRAMCTAILPDLTAVLALLRGSGILPDATVPASV